MHFEVAGYIFDEKDDINLFPYFERNEVNQKKQSYCTELKFILAKNFTLRTPYTSFMLKNQHLSLDHPENNTAPAFFYSYLSLT